MKWRNPLAAALVLALGAAGTAISAGAVVSSHVQAAKDAEIVAGPGGYVRVTETGYPPLGKTGAEARNAARDHARSRARERLLRAILALRLSDGRTVDQALRANPACKNKLKAVLGAATLSGADLVGDVVEITLTAPMDGPTGLSRFLADLEGP